MKPFVLSENVFDLKNLRNYESIMCRVTGICVFVHRLNSEIQYRL